MFSGVKRLTYLSRGLVDRSLLNLQRFCFADTQAKVPKKRGRKPKNAQTLAIVEEKLKVEASTQKIEAEKRPDDNYSTSPLPEKTKELPPAFQNLADVPPPKIQLTAISSPMSKLGGLASLATLGRIAKLANLDDLTSYLKTSLDKIQPSEFHLVFLKLNMIVTMATPPYRAEHLEKNKEVNNFLQKYIEIMKTGDDDLKKYAPILSASSTKPLIEGYLNFYAEVLTGFLDQMKSSSQTRQNPQILTTHLLETQRNITSYFSCEALSNSIVKDQMTKLFELTANVLDSLTLKYKMTLLAQMKSLRVFDDALLDHFIILLDKQLEEMSLDDVLLILYVNQNNRKVFPFETLYRFRSFIYPKLQAISTKSLVQIAYIYARLRMFYMEAFFERLFTTLDDEKRISDLSASETVLLMFAYSKQKFRNELFYERLMQKVSKSMGTLSDISVKMLLLSMAELSYMNDEIYIFLQGKLNIVKLVEKLKAEENLSNTNLDYFTSLCTTLLNMKTAKESVEAQITVVSSTPGSPEESPK